MHMKTDNTLHIYINVFHDELNALKPQNYNETFIFGCNDLFPIRLKNKSHIKSKTMEITWENDVL